MDRWIRWGLVGAWLLFGVAVLIWWRRRHAARHYPYSERASVILDALKGASDLSIVYWSKSEKKHLRRIVTPLELDGYSFKAFDHSINDVRIFKVTRIRQLTIVARGTRSVPSMLTGSISTLAVSGSGLVAAVLLGVALFRGQESKPANNPAESLTASFPAPPVEIVKTAGAAIAASSEFTVADTGTNSSPAVGSTETDGKWEVIVNRDPSYDTNRVAQTLQRVLGTTPWEAQEFARQVQTLGHASVWNGQWVKAEHFRQVLEAEDLIAHINRAQTD